MSPTQRSLKYLREQGYLAEVVERWNAFARIRQDLFGCIDILALREGETLAVQTTSWAHVPDRARKVRANPGLPAMQAAGWRIEVHGWKGLQLRKVLIE
jgi:hypothetical protein